MKQLTICVLVILAAIPTVGSAYDTSFTLTFEEPTDSTGWTDPIGGNTVFVTGENTPADAPPYATPPNTAANYNSTDWLRTGSDVQGNGVAVAIYDGHAGGVATTALDFVATVDVYINPLYAKRFQVGLITRVNGEFSPPSVFYSCGTPGNPDGYGWRGSGITSAYDGFGTGAETVAKWVRLKMTMIGATGTFEIDRDLDGVYDGNSGPITIAAAGTDAGQIGVISVINDPDGGSVRIPDQFSYFDNLTYSPIPASVSDWSVY